MHRLFLVFPLATALFLTGCAPSYNAQLVKLASPTLQTKPAGLVLDNDTLRLGFDFYHRHGLLRVTMMNKLNVPLYVDWKQSALIIGPDKFDYWQDVSDVNLTGSGLGSYGTRSGHYYNFGLSGTITREDRVSFLPPRTQTSKRQFLLVPGDARVDVNGPFTVVDVRATVVGDEPVHRYTFTASTSPLKFRHYLTVSTDRDFKNAFYIDTEFYAYEVDVMSSEQLQGTISGSTEQPDGYAHPFRSPNAFYTFPTPLYESSVQ